MHLGFDAKRAFNNTSGLGNYSRFVIGSLLRLYPQHRYTLFTPRINDLFRNFCPSDGAAAGVAMPRGFGRKLPAAWRTFGMAQEFRNRKIDLYHGLSNELPYNLPGPGTKLVVTIHDLIFLRFPELYRLPDRIIYKHKFADACRKAHHIVAISEQTKADIVHYFSIPFEKISVVYQDCDPVFHQPLQEAALSEIKSWYNLPENYVLCVGTIEPRKNQLTLLQAWHQSSAFSGTDLVLVGKQTAYTQQLHQYIQANNLEKRVHFLPYIPLQHLPGIYQLAQLFVYPSIFEGFGIPVLEALNCGVPVISSTGSCFSEAGGNSSVYVKPESAAELSQAIGTILSDPDRQQHMIEAGRQHALQFRAETTIPQLMKIYEEVVDC